MNESRFTIRVHRSCPELGLQAGDLVTFVPEIVAPGCALHVHRPLPANAGSLLTMLETGGAELITPPRDCFRVRRSRWLASAATGAGEN